MAQLVINIPPEQVDRVMKALCGITRAPVTAENARIQVLRLIRDAVIQHENLQKMHEPDEIDLVT